MLQLHHMDHTLNLVQHTTTVPCTFKEVMASIDQDQWLTAMRSKIKALMTNDIFNLVLLLPGHCAISTRWVLKLKALNIFKACFITCGFSQKAGINFDNTYVPVLHLENLHLLLAYLVMNGHIIHSMDINNAFLQADLHKEVYMTQPEGFMDPERPHHIYHQKKALYGLKQAPLTWNQTLNTFLINISFTAAAADPCLYALHNHSAKNNSNQAPYNPELHRTFIQGMHGKPLMILSVFMDDLLIVGLLNSVEAIKGKL